MAELELLVWLHPSMQIPFKFESKEHPFKVNPNSAIVDLMDDCEQVFEDASKKVGANMELQINVLWNVKDHKKALNPNDKVGQHFSSGETFGVYGDLLPLRHDEVPKSEEDKIPVTILTGFLGSGKTTLLNYILQEQSEKKLAIIENEFGEISIDDALLQQDKLHMAEQIIVMDNGCMCCTIRGDLENGLQEVLAKVHAGGTIDGIIIETTGMADPVPIVRTFMSNANLTSELRLDAVVSMADAKHIVARLDDEVEEGKVNEAYQQVAFADKIILNKLDLVTPDQAIVVKDRIRAINKYAKVLPAVHGRVRVHELTNIRAHDMCNFVNEDIDKEAEANLGEFEHDGAHGGHDSHGDAHGHDANCTEDHGHGGHGDGGHSGHGGTAGHGAGHGHGSKGANRHDARVNSFSIVREGEILPRRLSAWMQQLGQLAPERGTIFRIKAILAVKGHPYKHVFHAVMDVSDEDDAGPWQEGEKKISKIVFIGKSMDQAFLREGFQSIFE
eukprot:CAMPEP_0172844066 /NCGR_PEP_ID=MMETSP1075-20121228/31937_1 /TAXON_ID=2916 /ORGANISM="Ceratium fusus, Strain PA161109" /LENGTH=501 /DNA_ID=CAMNT_0013688441 /DNA_START=11 /DNA_END=1516 /DNA_ORIENTATION=+